MSKYRVRWPMDLAYGSHTRSSVCHYKTIEPGTIVTLDSVAPNGNVWFIDHEGKRGKIEAGCISNLERRGVVAEFFEQPDDEPCYPDDMHDDAEALASAGWGTDEDYGGGCEHL